MYKNQSSTYETNLIRRIQSGDKQAFEEFYRLYFEKLCRFINQYIRNPAVCEELIQDLFVKIWLHKDQLDSKGKVRSYLYKSARNRALDYLKHQEVKQKYLNQRKIEKERERAFELSDPEKNSFHLYGRCSDSDKWIHLIQEAIDQLPERRRMIFTLSRDEGLTYNEIAEVLDISVKTVETQIGRSLKTLRKLLLK